VLNTEGVITASKYTQDIRNAVQFDWDECRLLAGSSEIGHVHHPVCSNANPNQNTNPNPTADHN